MVLKTLAATIFCMAASVSALVRFSLGLEMVMILLLPAAFLKTSCKDFPWVIAPLCHVDKSSVEDSLSLGRQGELPAGQERAPCEVVNLF